MSRPRSAAPAAATASLVRRLLRDGARFAQPAREILETAGWLEQLGAVETRRVRTVRCANPSDQDFPPADRDCRGHIELYPDADADADEGGGDYRCPDCDRLVFPAADAKQVIDVVSIVLSRVGIERLLLDRLGPAVSGRGFSDGVLTAMVAGRRGELVLVDYCTNSRWLSNNTARVQPTIYVTVSPDVAPRMIADPALRCVEFADVLLDGLDLPAILAARAENPPQLGAILDMPVYALGSRPRGQVGHTARTPRVFTVGLSAEGVHVDGLLVLPASQPTPYAIMRHLVARLASALSSADIFGAVSIEELANEIEKDLPEAIDAEFIRKALNRTRKHITTTIRRVKGTPIDDNDIIEAVSRTGSLPKQQGYRLNPLSVVLGAACA